MKVLVLSMGGTIDAAPYPEDGPPPADITPTGRHASMDALGDIARTSGQDFLLDWIEICDKDSKYIDAQDLSLLDHAVIGKAAEYNRILVTVGTDRMTDIARGLKERLGNEPDCPVVFTGAIIPLANQDRTDAHANLRLALLGEPQTCAGVYIAMHDLFAPCELLRKDFATRRFVYAP